MSEGKTTSETVEKLKKIFPNFHQESERVLTGFLQLGSWWFMVEILVKDEKKEIIIMCSADITGNISIKEAGELKEKLKRINNRPEFKKRKENWLRMGIKTTEEKKNIFLIGALIDSIEEVDRMISLVVEVLKDLSLQEI